jgi:immune inhibitor A
MRRAVLFLVLAAALIACSGTHRSPAAVSRATAFTASPPAATTAPPLPASAPTGAAPAQNDGLEPELPHADRLDLARRLRGVTVPPLALDAQPVEQPGQQRDFWVVQSEPPRAFQVTATLRVVTAHAYLYVQNGTDVSDADMQRAGQDFEDKVYPTVTRLFGTPAFPPGDPNPRITILHLNLPGVGGYFTDIDQLPHEIARVSNERRMIYIDLRAGPPGTAAYPGLVAHEFQHLIEHDRNPYPDGWFNEGMSEVANEAVSGRGSFLRAYDNTPDTQLNDWAIDGSNSAHYGAAHSFLRYLLLHYGGLDHAGDLVGEGGRSLNAVERYLRDGGYGVGFEDVFADWLVAGYLNLPDGRFSNPGADTKIRTVTRLSSAAHGSDEVHQFGADYFEIETGGKDAVFRFRGAATVKQIPNEPASGQGQWWSGRGDLLDATLTRQLDLRSVAHATLRFKTWYDIERGYDYAYVTASTDGGASWTVLRGRHASDFDPLGQAYGPGYTGISGDGPDPTWVDEEVDLTPVAGKVVLLRFEYVTDEAASGPGFAVDDISVPEIGFTDDAEHDTGWQASGFRRITGPLPQRYLIQLVTEEAGTWTSRRVPVAPDGSGEIHIPGTAARAAVIIAGATYDTNLMAPYQWEFIPSGG